MCSSPQLPIGTDVANFGLTVVNDEGRPVQEGEIGEIVIASSYIALGYWRDPELSARVFAADATDPGRRIFRTGDLARRRPDGLLEFCGRKDHQIKLRGNRIELGEIESTIRDFDGIGDAAVLARTKGGEPRSLAAYVELRPGRQPGELTDLLASFLVKQLPAYMVPAAIIVMDALPRLPNLKIDQEALRLLEREERQAKAAAPPLTSTEVLLAGIWAKSFGLLEVNRDDDFFELGGDSLVAAAIGTAVHGALGIELGLDLFTDHPSLAANAKAIDEMVQATGASSMLPLVRVSGEHRFALSLIQERIWKYSQTPQQSTGYTDTYAHSIGGLIDREALHECISYMVRRHHCLRTSFDVVDGQPTQIVSPPSPVQLPFFDVSGRPDPAAEARSLVENGSGQPFDLKHGPLIRFSLIRLGRDWHWLVHSVHHIISDEASWEVFFRELAATYDARIYGKEPPLQDEVPLQYGEYAVWQRAVLRPNSPRYQAMIDWWARLLSQPSRPLELPFKRPKPRRRSNPAEGFIWWQMAPDTSAKLADLARTQRTTFFVICVAALMALLATETGNPDIAVGSYFQNRNKRELRDMIGCFLDLVMVRLRYQTIGSFRDWLRVVRDRVLETMAHAEVPFELLQQELRGRGVAVGELRVILGIAHLRPLDSGSLDIKRLSLPRTQANTVMPWGFSLHIQENGDGKSSASFDASLYDPDGVRRFVERYGRFLDAIAADADHTVEFLLSAR